MKYRHLGRAGIQVGELSFGSWITFNNQLDVDAAMACMSVAYEAGANFFDNAEAYALGKSEEIMGMALRKLGYTAAQCAGFPHGGNEYTAHQVTLRVGLLFR